MAYFLKKTRVKGKVYLSIVESFYSGEKKGTAQKVYKSLMTEDYWKGQGIEDPEAHFRAEVDAMNAKRGEEGKRKIGDVAPVTYLGYFPLSCIADRLGAERDVAAFGRENSFRFDLYDMLMSLVYARAVYPCSKRKTFHDVLPNLFHAVSYSYDQMLEGLGFIGANYEKFVEIFTERTRRTYGLDTSVSYFDGTNFYFEIDREDDFRRKGPSKENRREPIVGMGLLLDAGCIPIGMKLFPGNMSEKPVMRQALNSLKNKSGLSGRTVCVADKGFNCASNIAAIKKNGDGYIFSKSVKLLPETEKTWVNLTGGFEEVKGPDGEILYYRKSCVDDFDYTVEVADGVTARTKFREKRMVTYNPSLARKQRGEIDRMVRKARSLTRSRAKREEYGESARFVEFVGPDGGKAEAVINEDAVKKDMDNAGYNMIVTSETNLSDDELYATYHNLWHIEESFKILKGQLDARPVFLQKEETIKGHFLVCYVSVLLERLFQYKVLDERFSYTEIFDFMRDFKVTRGEQKYINTMTESRLVRHLTDGMGLPIDNFYLSESQITHLFNLRM